MSETVKRKEKEENGKKNGKLREKVVQIGSFFWSVFSLIQSKYRKMRTRKNSVFGHFSCSDCLKKGKQSFNTQYYKI